jgi:hypothetical protein
MENEEKEKKLPPSENYCPRREYISIKKAIY